MKTYSQFVAESVDFGLYTYRKLNPHSADIINEWMLDNRIPNPLPTNQLHCTVVCSDVAIPKYEPDTSLVMLNPATYQLDMLEEALVVKFQSDPISEQQQRAMNMGGKNHYPTFVPHFSLSYKVPLNFEYEKLKPPPAFVVLEAEEARPMKDGWAAIDEYEIGNMTLDGAMGGINRAPNKPEIYIPQNSLNIPREEMPQIADANKMAFVDWLEAQGIVVQYVDLPVALLRSTQSEFDMKKVEKLQANMPQKVLNNPVIVSKDLYVFDGHHRFLSILNRDPHYAIKAYRVNLPIQELLDIAKKYEHAFYQPSS